MSRIVLFGVDTLTGEKVPVSVDSDGRINLTADVNVGDVNIGTVSQGAKDVSAEPWETDVSDREARELGKVQLSGSIVEEWREQTSHLAYATTSVYYGLHQFGTLKYNGTELRRPLRPYRSDHFYSIINTDAGTSSNIQFHADGNRITISSETFDCRMLDIGDEIEVSDTSNNNGTYTISSLEDDEIVVEESLTDEGPSSATIEAGGDVPEREGINLDGYEFADTSNVAANRLNWHVFGDVVAGKPKIIMICDRALVASLSWNHINGSDLIFGKTVEIDGVKFLCRSLTGGDRNRDGGSRFSYAGGSLPNEWDRYIMNGIDQDLGPFFDDALDPEENDYLDGSQSGNNTARRRAHNQHWNWLVMYTWGQETFFDDSSRRCSRGNTSARLWYPSSAGTSHVSNGFRPVLQLPL